MSQKKGMRVVEFERLLRRLQTEAGDWNLMGRLVLALGIIILARILVRLVNYLIGKRLQGLRFISDMQPSRVITLVRLIQRLVAFACYFLAALFILNMFNVNTSTVLATAGIGSLAIGMGAQTLIKDLINGFFIILEDQYAVGDYIEAAGASGKVEDLGVRVTKLRDFDGTLHIIPNSEIRLVKNMERGPMRARVDLLIDEAEDPRRVIRLLEGAMETLQSPDHPGQGPTCWGVTNCLDNGYIITIAGHRDPGDQYDLDYKIRRLAIQTLQEAGVAMPRLRIEGGSKDHEET